MSGCSHSSKAHANMLPCMSLQPGSQLDTMLQLSALSLTGFLPALPCCAGRECGKAGAAVAVGSQPALLPHN